MKYTETKAWQDHWRKKMMDSDVAMKEYMAAKNEADDQEQKIKEALEVLHISQKSIADILFHCLTQEHRTHQQSIVRNLALAIQKYGESDFDLRNEAAVQWAKKVTNEQTYFPFL